MDGCVRFQSGDRTTLRKAALEEATSLAFPFSAREGAGIICISSTGLLRVSNARSSLTNAFVGRI